MATIKPFRGCRYDVAAVGNLSAVICPPYDMIGPELKSELQQRSPYNAVHLEGGEQPDPVDPQAGYQQAAARFEDWLAEGKLCREDAPAFYVMRHAYNFGGRHYQHLGLFADVLVEDYDAGAVLPHEFTREPSVLDRVALLDACQAQFSPIMSLYRDSEGGLRRILDDVVAASPDASATTPAGGNAEFWCITEPDVQATIVDTFAGPADLPRRRSPPLRSRAALSTQPARRPTVRRPRRQQLRDDDPRRIRRPRAPVAALPPGRRRHVGRAT